MTSLTFSHECLILDACCIINLYASGQMEAILRAVPGSVTVAVYVKNEEVLKVYDPATKATEDIDLRPFIDRNLLVVVDLDLAAEAETYVNFAALVDDGEAITGAIARHRNWAIGTDDKTATKIFRRAVPQLQIISTPDLVKYWVSVTNPPADDIKACLQAIRIRASYAPPRNHHLYEWWSDSVA